MLRPLLLLAGLVLTSIHAGHAQAQYTFAGQTAGTAYTSLTPFVVLTGRADYSAGGGTSQQYEADVDTDGRADLRFQASGTVTLGSYGSHSLSVWARHGDVQLYAATESPTGPACVSLASGDTLQAVMHRRTAAGTRGSWSDGSLIHNGSTYYDPFSLSLVASGALGPYSGGGWLDGQEHYLGFRLRANAAAPWRYGWLLAQATSTSNPATLIVKGYALASQPLSLLPPQAGGWQVYPTQVADQLTIQLPVGMRTGWATVFDLYGRNVVDAELLGSQQQLRLSALAAGVYIVQLATPAGRFAQRIIKR